MKYTVKRIDEYLDFGCEERSEGAPALAVVTLEDENGEVLIRNEEDKLLYDRDINEGDETVIDEEGHLQKV